MHAIVDSAGQVNARVGQIADAAHAQAAGLVQVRQAIEQLRQRA
jgi:methyl-accepting chemotaxis protein